MKFRVVHGVPIFSNCSTHLHQQRRCFTFLFKKLKTTTAQASLNGGGSGSSKGAGDSFLVPGATAATLLMLGVLQGRRMYNDMKAVEAQEAGTELEFQPDVKSKFLRLLPLRSVSRCWGVLTSVEIPVSLRPHVYKAFARAFHSNLEDAALPLDEYASLQEFFVRTLKEGSRPIDPDPQCLVSPVDGTVLRFGEIKGAGAMIEQVKGFSYSVFSLLGASSMLPTIAKGDMHAESSEPENAPGDKSQNSWLSISLASPKDAYPVTSCPMKGLFYCVIYLKPGDYHRVHAPADWNIHVRRHFSGNLYPVNERATRTIKNLYVENERVVLEGLWRKGFMALAAVGATNIGSIELSIEPELRTNQPKKKLLHSEVPEERLYEPDALGKTLKKGDEVAAFNMGSTVVLVFQAPMSMSQENGDSSSDFKFSIQRGDRVRVGEALGRCRNR